MKTPLPTDDRDERIHRFVQQGNPNAAACDRAFGMFALACVFAIGASWTTVLLTEGGVSRLWVLLSGMVPVLATLAYYLYLRAPHMSDPSLGWQPIDTAPRDGKRPILIAQFNEAGELVAVDWGAEWVGESESWELPHVYYYWASMNGNVDEPTHWMYEPEGFTQLRKGPG